jgi:hypothetical protein
VKRGGPLKRTPLARIGRRAKAKASLRATTVNLVRRRDVRCQFVYWVMQAKLDRRIDQLEEPLSCSPILDVHELMARSKMRDAELDPDNCVLLCRAHHEWLDRHRDQAQAIGLYRREKS